jgi:SAM-dependent methyltransferase
MTTSPAQAVLPHRTDAPASMQMLEMLYGALATQMISVAAELGVADLLADGPRPVAELAAGSGADTRSLHRLLRALAGLGVFRELTPGTFELTPLAETLRTGVKGSMKELAQDVGGRTRLLAYSELAHSVRTGTPAFDKAHGTSMWAYLQAHPDEVALFGKAMGNLAGEAHSTAFANYDLSDVEHLVDVGGGEGYLLAALLPYYPDMKGTVFDEPHVVGGAAEVLARAGIADRAEAVGGDVFQAVPADGDAYVLSSILFSYEDDEARTILANIRQAMDPGGRVLVLEPILPEGNDPHPGKLLDVTQLALHRGGVRSRAEFEALFAAAGLRLAETREMWPAGPTDLVVAVPA